MMQTACDCVYVSLNQNAIGQTPYTTNTAAIDASNLKENIAVNSIWLLMKYSSLTVCSRDLLRQKLSIFVSIHENKEVFWVCFPFTKEIYKHNYALIFNCSVFCPLAQVVEIQNIIFKHF